MKLYLVQEKLPDGEMFAKMKPATEIINDFGFRDCTDAEYEVYDVSEFGKIIKLEHWPAISAPFNYHRFVNPESRKVVFEGYSPEH